MHFNTKYECTCRYNTLEFEPLNQVIPTYSVSFLSWETWQTIGAFRAWCP